MPDWDEFEHDDHCDSYIRYDMRGECVCLLLNIKTYVSFWSEAKYGLFYDTARWGDGEQQKFKNEFQTKIRQGWGDGAIWLSHSEKLANVWCDVQIEYVTETHKDTAQLVIMALKTPTPIGPRISGFRATTHSKRRPVDMEMPYEGVVGPRTKHGEGGVFQQYTCQHEFGHYLGCEHFCEWAGEANDPKQYCDGREAQMQDHIMARGNKWDASNPAVLWFDRDPRAGAARVGAPFVARLELHRYATTNIKAWVAKEHNDDGGGRRSEAPWI